MQEDEWNAKALRGMRSARFCLSQAEPRNRVRTFLLKLGAGAERRIDIFLAYRAARLLLKSIRRDALSSFARTPPTGFMRGIDFYGPRLVVHAVARSLHDYKNIHGSYPNLTAPRTLNEKITWAKFFADLRVPESGNKLLTSRFIPDELISEISCPQIVWRSPDPNLLANAAIPAGDYYLKANHGSGFVKRVTFPLIREERDRLIEISQAWLKNQYGFEQGEWWYQSFPKEIFLEQALCSEAASIAFMFHVFSGDIGLITACRKGPDGAVRESIWTDPDFVTLPYRNEGERPLHISLSPEMKGKLKFLASRIGQPFQYVRVDLLLGELGRPYLGELTFAPNNGLMRWPEELDLKLGEKWKLRPCVSSRVRRDGNR